MYVKNCKSKMRKIVLTNKNKNPQERIMTDTSLKNKVSFTELRKQSE